MKKTLSLAFAAALAFIVMLGFSSCGKEIEFSVNFVVDGEAYAIIGTSGNEAIKIPENPTKDGYTFDGWYWDNGVWQKPFTANSLLDAPLSSDMSVYAKWNCNHVAWGDWIETTKPTCQAKGEETRACACGAEETRETVKDANNHTAWGAWDVTTPATCQATGVDTRTCACGHSETRDSEKDMTNHVAWGNWIETTKPTCQATGVDTRTCACGHSETRDVAKDMTNHVAWGDWIETTPATCQATGVDTRTCACGHSETRDSEKDMSNHVAWGNWIETTKPTCQATGVDTRTCACGHSETRDSEKDMSNHVAWGDWIETTKPTCQATGVDTRTCACGHSETRDVAKDMTNHVAWGDWIETTPATCQATGVDTRTCACGHSETRDSEKDMSNHVAWGDWGVTTPATCQAKGVDTRTCACGHSETRDSAKDMTNHVAWGDWGVTTPATCQATGEETRTCACGHSETRVAEINPNAHAYTIGEKGADGHWYSCAHNGCTSTTAVVEHDWNEWTITLAPTCQAEGSRYHICYFCEYKATEVIPIDLNAHTYTVGEKGAEGHWYSCAHVGCTSTTAVVEHDWNEWTITLAPTCQAEGSRYHICYFCEYKAIEVAPIDPNAHIAWGNWIETTAPTCQATGVDTRTCACGHSETRDVAINPNAHTFAGELSFNSTHHYYECACGSRKDETKHISSGAATATQDEVCTVCGYVINPAVGIQFKTLTVEGNVVHGKVPNTTTQFSFINEIAMVGGAKYAVLLHVNDNNPVLSKTIDLAIGDNTVYILELIDGEPTNVYTVTIRRRPMYEITFVANGNVFASDKIEEQSFLPAPDSVPQKTGYHFVGWSLTNGGTETVTMPYQVHEDTAFYAVFVPNTYHYTYNVNGGDALDSVEGDALFNGKFTLATPTRTGYTFKGWRDAKGTVRTGSFTWTYTEDMTFTAVWQANTYTVTYDYAGGSHASGTKQTVTFDAAYALREPTRAGYTFKGYALDGKEFVKGETYTYPNGITLVAQWEIIVYNLTAHEDDATTKANNVTTYTVEDAITLKSPEKVGYTFTGWYTAETGGSKVTEIAKGSTGDVVLYARFTPNTYTITYNYAGGSHTSGTKQTVTFDAAYTLREPTRAGYTFKSYTLDGETFVKGDAYTYPNGITLVAQWEIITYTITYDINGGVPVSGNPVTYTTLSTEQLIAPPDREYYTFLGWYSDSQKVEKLTGLYGNLALVAKWGAHFTLSGNTLTKFTDYGKSYNYTTLIIPAELEGVSITEIGSSAFKDCAGLTSITIPSSVTSIGKQAFYGCTGAIQREGGVSYVDKWAIDCNSTMTSVSLRADTVGISSDAFVDCTKLASVTIPPSVMNIGFGTFAGCSDLQSITLPFVGGSIKTSSDTYQYPFGYIFGTSSYDDSIETEQWYYGSSTSSTTSSTYYIPASLRSVTITGGNILHGAFYGCAYLTNIMIPSSVTFIGRAALLGCRGLTSFTIPASVTSIGDSAFYGCSGFTSITIPSSVKSIGSGAFYHCTGFTSITLPNSVTTIDTQTFYGCTGLTSITIPSSVKSIGSGAFYNCYSLTSITIPDSVTSIGASAFLGCKGLTNVIFGKNNQLTSIGRSAFEDCERLTSITIPLGVTRISGRLFAGCNGLTSVVISSSVSIIDFYAFENCKGLTSITIPSSVKNIGNHAFERCTGLTSITIPSSVTSIGEQVFYGCTGLQKVLISDIAAWCGISFSDLTANPLFYAKHLYLGENEVTELVIPESVTRIGSYAFNGCTGLTSITIPSSVKSIGDSAFYKCTGLQKAYYGGTASQWSSISISSDNGKLTAATRYYYSAEAPTTTGNYWHYDENGNVVEW